MGSPLLAIESRQVHGMLMLTIIAAVTLIARERALNRRRCALESELAKAMAVGTAPGLGVRELALAGVCAVGDGIMASLAVALVVVLL